MKKDRSKGVISARQTGGMSGNHCCRYCLRRFCILLLLLVKIWCYFAAQKQKNLISTF